MAVNRLNMISYIFYLQLFLLSFIGAVIVVNNLDDHYLITRLSSDSSRFYGWASVMYTMIAMPLGMLMASVFLKQLNTKKLFDTYSFKKTETIVSNKDSYLKLPLIMLSFISVLAVVYTFYTIRTIPLFGVFTGKTAEMLARMRIEASREFGGNVIFRNIFAIALTPILSYISYAYYKASRSKGDLLWFGVMFFASVMISTYSLAKSPIVSYLLGFLLLNILINGKISYKFLISVGTVILLILIWSYIFIMGADVSAIPGLFLKINQGITGRLLLSQSAGTFFSFDIFPDKHPHLGISSFSNLISNVFSIDKSDRSARIIMSILNPTAVEEGTAGVINSLFVGEAWANFGLLGVVFAPLWVGFVIQWSYIILLKLKKNPIFLSLMVYLTLRWPVTGGFNDFVYNAGIAMMLMIFIAIICFAVMTRIVNTGKNVIMVIKKKRADR